MNSPKSTIYPAFTRRAEPAVDAARERGKMRASDRDVPRLYLSQRLLGLTLITIAIAISGCATKAPATDPELANRSPGGVSTKVNERRQIDSQELASAQKAAKDAERRAEARRFQEELKEKKAERKTWETKAKQAGTEVCRTFYPLRTYSSFKVFGTTLSASGERLRIQIQSIREYDKTGYLVNGHSRFVSNINAEPGLSGQPRKDVFYQVGDSVSEAVSEWGPC
jgi:hypothetical protein